MIYTFDSPKAEEKHERLGQFGDQLGRNSSFDITKADPNPPPQGSTAGYIVASNFAGATPAGVVRAGNTSANDAKGQNTLAPRIGFSWQVLPDVPQLLVRGAYGMYYSRPTGQTAAKFSANNKRTARDGIQRKTIGPARRTGSDARRR